MASRHEEHVFNVSLQPTLLHCMASSTGRVPPVQQQAWDALVSFLSVEGMCLLQLCDCCTGLLWTVTPKLVWFLFLYAGVGTWITTSAFGKRLMQLHFTTVQREGDLRFDMVRTRENAGEHTAQHVIGCDLTKDNHVPSVDWCCPCAFFAKPAAKCCNGQLILLTYGLQEAAVSPVHARMFFPDQACYQPVTSSQDCSFCCCCFSLRLVLDTLRVNECNFQSRLQHGQTACNFDSPKWSWGCRLQFFLHHV